MIVSVYIFTLLYRNFGSILRGMAGRAVYRWHLMEFNICTIMIYIGYQTYPLLGLQQSHIKPAHR